MAALTIIITTVDICGQHNIFFTAT